MPTFDDHNARRAARAARHAVFNPVRDASFRLAEATVSASDMPSVSYTIVDAAARAAYRPWVADPARGRDWPWPSLVDDTRADDPACFEAAIWCDGMLCGLAVGAGSRDHAAIEFLERSPDAAHPLRGSLLAIAVTGLLAYATILGRPGARLVRPNKHAIAAAIRAGVSFDLVDIPGQHPYLSIHG